MSSKLTSAERKKLRELVLQECQRWGPPPSGVPSLRRDHIDADIRNLEKLTSPEFVAGGPMLAIISTYRTQRFAQSPRNMSELRISTEAIRRELRKVAAVRAEDPDYLNATLERISHHARHFIAISLKLPGVGIGTYWQGLFDDLPPSMLIEAARKSLDHPDLRKAVRGRKLDQAGDALIRGTYNAFTTYGLPVRIWEDGRNASLFIKVVALLFSIAGDPKCGPTLRDRSRRALASKRDQLSAYQEVMFVKLCR